METRNDKRSIELRRRRTNLTTIGSGVILFGIWTIVKTAYMMFIQGNIQEILPGADEIAASGVNSNAVIIGAYVEMVIIMLIDLGLRIIVGRRAKAEGRGQTGVKKYRFAAVILMIGSIMSLLIEVMVMFRIGPGNTADRSEVSISSLIVEATSLILMIELLYNSSRTRKLTRQEGY